MYASRLRVHARTTSISVTFAYPSSFGTNVTSFRRYMGDVLLVRSHGNGSDQAVPALNTVRVSVVRMWFRGSATYESRLYFA